MKSKTQRIIEHLQHGTYTAAELEAMTGIPHRDIQIRYFSYLKKHYKEDFVVIKEPGKRTRYHITDQSPYKSKPLYRNDNMEPIYDPIIDISKATNIHFPERVMTKQQIKDWANSKVKIANKYSCQQLFKIAEAQGVKVIGYTKQEIEALHFSSDFLNMKEPILSRFLNGNTRR